MNTMTKQEVSSIITALAAQQHETLAALHHAQLAAVTTAPACEAVELVLRYQRIADKINRVFDADIRQLAQLVSDW